MATKAQALEAIQQEAADVKAKIDALTALIENRQDVPDDVVEAIRNIFTDTPPAIEPEIPV